jgi:hypothetical protein
MKFENFSFSETFSVTLAPLSKIRKTYMKPLQQMNKRIMIILRGGTKSSSGALSPPDPLEGDRRWEVKPPE